MDLKDTVLILCSSGKGLEVSAVSVDCRQEYSAKLHPTLNKNIDIEWENRLKNCSNLFDGSKFRLHGVETEQICGANVTRIKFLVGSTSYKEFIGTNCSSYAKQLSEDGMRDFQNPQAYMADPIGVGALLVSKDNDLLFIRRSDHCAEMAGMIDRPGGHPEPDEVQSAFDVDPSAVAEEIFASVLKEVRDEINIPLECLSPPILLGIGFNPKTWKRPSIEFYVRCSLSTEEIMGKYLEATQAEAEESTGLLTIPVQEVFESHSLKFFDDLTHACQTALFLLKIFLLKEEVDVIELPLQVNMRLKKE